MTDIQEEIRILVALQAVELEILQAGRRMDALNDEATTLDQVAVERAALVNTEKRSLDDIKKSYRELEGDSKDNAALIAKSNEKLRAVKTNKEYQSMLKEIEEIQKRNSAIEDQMIEMLDRIESQETAVREKEAQLAAFAHACDEKKKVLADAVLHERRTIASLNEKQAQVKAEADPKTVAILADVKRKVRGMAVVPAQQAVCMGCHMNIPAQLFNELLRYDELRFCPHCSRIIYWKERDGE